MPSVQSTFSEEILHGHREAFATLRELLATETDRTERRKLANALLRVRPAKPDPDASPAQRERDPRPASTITSGAPSAANTTPPTTDPELLAIATAFALSSNAEDDEAQDNQDDLLDEDSAALDREATQWAHRILNAPDREAALRELREHLNLPSTMTTDAAGSP